MSYWELIASRTDGQYTTEDFESAAYRLVSEQVIYHSDKHSRVAYALIERFARNFETALEPLGIDIKLIHCSAMYMLSQDTAKPDPHPLIKPYLH